MLQLFVFILRYLVTSNFVVQLLHLLWVLGNSVIAVYGDEMLDLENTQLYQKASRSSLT